jgi:excisionase family DNA binding protein
VSANGNYTGPAGGLTFTIELTPEQLDALAKRVAPLLELSPPDDGYLNTADAARYLACPTSRVHDLVQLGKVHPLRDGRRLLFRRSDLDACLEAN